MSTLDNPNDYIDPSSISLAYYQVWLATYLVLVVLGLLVHLSGMITLTRGGSNWVVNILNWGITIAAIVMAVKQHREEDPGGFISLPQLPGSFSSRWSLW